MARIINTVCGIEMGNDLLSVVQYDPQRGAVTAVAVKPIDKTGEAWWEAIGYEFGIMAEQMKLRGIQPVCSLPSDSAIIKKLLLDSGSDDIEGSLEWELSQQIIGSADEYVFDFHKCGGRAGFATDNYLTVAFMPEPLKRLSALLKSNKLKPSVIDLDLFALMNVFEVNYPDAAAKTAALVLAGNEQCSVLFCRGGEFIDYERIPYRAESTDAGRLCELLRDALQRCTVLNALEEPAAAVYLSGQLFFDESFRQECLSGLEGAVILDPFRHITCDVLEAAERDKHAPQLSVATGLALRGAMELQ
jgi:Tfp pilus assembly PilM family ATPase